MKENPRYKGILIGEDGNEIPGTEFTDWKSRSMAVAVFPVCDGKILVGKRGPNCPDNIGKWCAPCGYLGWDETISEAASRELYEETGIRVDPKMFEIVGINSDPMENRQNVTVRFKVSIPSEQLSVIDTDSESRGGEKDEFSEIRTFGIDEVEGMNSTDFAFGHREIILKVFGS